LNQDFRDLFNYFILRLGTGSGFGVPLNANYGDEVELVGIDLCDDITRRRLKILAQKKMKKPCLHLFNVYFIYIYILLYIRI
jgi:hypothetical protein